MKKVIFLMCITFVLLFAVSCSAGEAEPQSGFFIEGEIFRPEDFEGRTFAVIMGSIWDIAILAQIPTAEFLFFNSEPEAIMALRQGKVDATLGDSLYADRYAVMYPDLMVLHPPIYEAFAATVFNKDKYALVERFNEMLGGLRESGELDEILSRWSEPDPPPMQEFPSSGVNGTLIFATSGTSDVFSFYHYGVVAGYEVELAHRFAQFVEMELVIQVMDGAGIIPAVVTGMADFGGSGFAITEERALSIDFTDPIFTGGLNIMIRNPAAVLEQTGFWENFRDSVDRNLIQEDRWRLVVDGLGVSLTITIFAFALSVAGGFGVCALRMSKNKILNFIGNIYVNILRGTPIVVLLMIAYYIVFAGANISPTIVAVVAFGANGAAFSGEIIRSAILTVDKGQVEAALSMGFGKAGAFFTVTFPQAVRTAFPVYMSDFVSLFKMTAVVGYIAIVDLTRAGDIIRSRTFDAFFPLIMIAVVYLIIASAMVWLFNLINRKTNKRLRGAK